MLKYLLLIVLLVMIGGVVSVGLLDLSPPVELHKKAVEEE